MVPPSGLIDKPESESGRHDAIWVARRSAVMSARISRSFSDVALWEAISMRVLRRELEEVARVERIVAKVLERFAAELGSARSRDEIDDGPDT